MCHKTQSHEWGSQYWGAIHQIIEGPVRNADVQVPPSGFESVDLDWARGLQVYFSLGDFRCSLNHTRKVMISNCFIAGHI